MTVFHTIHLHTAAGVHYHPLVEQERDQALRDLQASALFLPVSGLTPPLTLALGIEEDRLVFTLEALGTGVREVFPLTIKGLRGVVRDYFAICESYNNLVHQGVSPCRLEAIDQGRRGVHDDGARQVMDALRNKATVDLETARRLFTLICILHIRDQGGLHG
jgi:uncharacterized protein (UPF0262 family)